MPDENRNSQIPDPEWEAFLGELNGDKPTPQPDSSPMTTERSLDPKETKREAIRLTEIEETIIAKIKAGEGQSMEDLFYYNLDPFARVVAFGEIPRRIGASRVSLTNVASFSDQVGINTEIELSISSHSDNERGGTSSSAYGYIFYFTREGQYAKISTVKPEHANNRKQVGAWIPPTLIYVQDEMTASDFELAGAALQVLLDTFKPPYKPQAEAK